MSGIHLPKVNFTDDRVVSYLMQSGRMFLPQQLFDLKNLVLILCKLVNWYDFGILLKIPPYVLDKIEYEHSVKFERKKMELFKYWLDKGDNPTWYKVYDALMNMPKREEDVLKDFHNNVFPLVTSQVSEYTHSFPPPPAELTIAHQGNVARSLTEIQKKFARLVCDIQEALENLPFVKIKRFISGFLHTTLKFDKKPHDLDELFDQLKPHYCFMSYELLKEVVEEFVKESMNVRITEYTSHLEEWLLSTTVVEFKAAVENQLEQVTQLGDCLYPVVPVVLKLEGPWIDVTVSNLWKLLKYIFRDKSSVLTHIHIERGSVIVSLLAPQSELLPLISLASKRKNDMIYLGIESIHIGVLIIKSPGICQIPFNFNASLLEVNNPFLVQFYIELGVNPNTQDKLGNTPLITASFNGDINVVIALLEHNVNINIKTKSKHSALHFAARFGREEIARLLLRAGLNTDDQDETGATPVFAACEADHKAIVELLVQKKADINLTDVYNQSALMAACQNNFVAIVQLLLQAGANPNLQRQDGTTALHIACGNGSLESAQTLLQFKANPNIQNTNGVTPLMMAMVNKYHNIVELLVKTGANVELKTNGDGNTALISAVHFGNPVITATLLKAKANVNVQDDHGWTALFIASFKGDKETVKQLLIYKADPNLCAKDGTSPLHAASNRDITELLLKAGASPNAVGGPDGASALHRACTTGNIDVVQLLLHNNANPNAFNRLGLTPLCVAAINGHVEIAHNLLKAGAQVDLQRTDKDWTPLFFAAVGGHFEVVDLLLKYGASLKENKHGVTPQVAASLAGQYDISQHLFEVAASTDQLSLLSPPPLVPTESTSLDTDQSSMEPQITPSDKFISQTPLINEEENTSNRPSTQPSEENVLSYFNKVHSTISSGVKWIQTSYDNMIKRFENYLETSTRLQTHI